MRGQHSTATNHTAQAVLLQASRSAPGTFPRPSPLVRPPPLKDSAFSPCKAPQRQPARSSAVLQPPCFFLRASGSYKGTETY